jgi:hypothetical protein
VIGRKRAIGRGFGIGRCQPGNGGILAPPEEPMPRSIGLIALIALLVASCGPDEPQPASPAPLLTVEAKVARIRALQDGRTDLAEEREIVELFEATTGAELRTLKAALDGGGSDANLVHLVWSDIDDGTLRHRLLAHLAGSSRGLDGRPVRVLSDIDDTIYASWIDARYPEGTTYPGVLAFYDELVRAAGEDPTGGAMVTFISARPGDRLGAVEGVTADKLAELGFPRATLLAGTFVGLTSHEAMAEAKYANFDRYRTVYPEYRFVFVGDSGQGDAAFGASILRDSGDDVLAVFIHDVVNVEEGKERTPEHVRAAAAEQRLFYFDTYPDAARVAAERGLMSVEAAERVVAAAAE